MSPDITVDRIESDLALLEIGEVFVELPLAALPPNTKEGDMLRLIKQDGREQSLDTATSRLNRLAKRDDGNDIIEL